MSPEPRFKRNPNNVNGVQEMVNTLVNGILSYEIRHLAGVLDSLVKENQRLGGTVNAFLYNGSIHSIIQGRFLKGISVFPLHPSLEDAADWYITRRSRVDRDQQRLINGLSVVALKCKTKQEVRDVLPETLIGLVPELAEIPRFREEGYLLKHNPTLLKQFEDTANLLLDYQAKRLIY